VRLFDAAQLELQILVFELNRNIRNGGIAGRSQAIDTHEHRQCGVSLQGAGGVKLLKLF
jgi:hypothetical protein